MPTLQDQLALENRFAKQNVVPNIKFKMPQLTNYVEDYVDSIINHFEQEDCFHYTTKQGEHKFWETKHTRYQYVCGLTRDQILKLAWEIVIFSIIKPKTTFTEVLGKIYKKIDLDVERLQLETAADMISLLKNHPFIEFEYPKNSDTGVMMIVSKTNLPKNVQDYLDGTRFVLPSITEPELVKSNKDCGYLTIKDGIILGGKNHDYPVNLHHINRVNRIPLRVNVRIPKLVNPVFKEKDGETPKERKERYDNWYIMNVESVQLLAQLSDLDIYLTNKYDERGRTYARGHHFNSQGDDYRKACIELAHQEVVRKV